MFLNSHLLGEVERLCDRVAIVDHGRVVAAGTLAELLGESAVRIRVTGLPADAAVAAPRAVRPGRPRRRLAGRSGPSTPTGSRTPSPRSSPPAAASTPSTPAGAASRTCSWTWSGTTMRRRAAAIANAAHEAAADPRDRGPHPARVRPPPDLWVLLVLSVVERRCSSAGASTGWCRSRARAGSEELEIQIGVSQVLILIAFMFSFVLAMSAAFLAAPAIASDVETGTVLAMLARPLRRADLVIGRWLGLSIVVAGYAARVGPARDRRRGPRQRARAAVAVVAVAFLAFQAIIVLTLALALGTRLPSIAAGAVTVVLFGLGWFVGVLGSIAVAFEARRSSGCRRRARWSSRPTGCGAGVVYGLEPPLVLLLAAGRGREGLRANPFFAAAPPPPTFLAWAVVWVVSCCSAASPCSAAGSCEAARGLGSAACRTGSTAAWRRAGRPPRVVDRPEHVRRDGLLAPRARQHDLVQAAGRRRAGAGRAWQRAHVRARVLARRSRQLVQRQRRRRPR